MGTYIKVCGLTNTEDAIMTSKLNVNAIGFNLFEKSKRYINLNQITKIKAKLPDDIEIFLLFVNQQREFVSESLKALPGAIPQFHGEETIEYCESFNTDYVKAVRIYPTIDLEKINQDYKSAKMLILDSFNDDAYGGTGQTFNLSLIEGKINLPFLVAGGIDESNFKQAVVLDNCIGIDVCSSIEDKPGIKNHKKLKNLVKNVRSFNV